MKNIVMRIIDFLFLKHIVVPVVVATIILMAIIFSSCDVKPNPNSEPEIIKRAKYKHGDIVYLKPDSTKAVILEIHAYDKNTGYVSGSPYYRVDIYKSYRFVEENCIFPKTIPNESKEY